MRQTSTLQVITVHGALRTSVYLFLHHRIIFVSVKIDSQMVPPEADDEIACQSSFVLFHMSHSFIQTQACVYYLSNIVEEYDAAFPHYIINNMHFRIVMVQ